ncbi:putative manganese transporter [Alteromonas ponticola]|nr:putative manganese transporter [Alteromonas ponticola]
MKNSPISAQNDAEESRHWLINKRFCLPIALVILLWLPSSREVTLQVLADAYFQVAVFVYVSLALYYMVTLRIAPERIKRFMHERPIFEVGVAAMLGALPGCGGAIIVVTQYTKGVSSFGAVVAVLTSTMGDAAFLLLTQSPVDGLTVMLIGVVIGTLTGWVVNRLHNYQPALTSQNQQPGFADETCHKGSVFHNKISSISTHFWTLVWLPSLILAVLMAFQVDVAALLNIKPSSLALIGASLALSCAILWSLTSSGAAYCEIMSEEKVNPPVHWYKKAALDTQFVLAWVVVAFLCFELALLWLELDLVSVFNSLGGWVVAMAVVIGFVPGCGPQIVVTTLYLNGALPFSAQLGNAISNDGDALFPAIALAPKAALLATLYSAIPAFVVGYGYYLLFEI